MVGAHATVDARRAGLSRSVSVPPGLQAVIDRTLRDEPVTSPAGLTLSWGKGGAVSFTTRKAPGDSFVLRPESIGRVTQVPFSSGSFVFGGSRTTEALGQGVTAWYKATLSGFEQGFTLSRRPRDPRKQFSLVLTYDGHVYLARGVSGGLVVSGPGGPVMTYEGLRAIDARGRLLPAHLNVSGTRLQIVVDDEDAVYPVTIDPFVAPTTAPVATLVDPAPILVGEGGDGFGDAVALSGDGQTALVAAPEANSGDGAVYLYADSGGSWPTSATATFSGSPGAEEFFGSSVALSADGSTALIGAPSGDGGAYLYTEPSGGWPTAPIPTSAAMFAFPAASGSGEELGESVALSSNGEVALLGAPGYDSSDGVAYIYTGSGASWSLSADLDGVAGAQGSFGAAVALSPDGSQALVGAYDGGTDFGDGAAYLYTEPPTGWGGDPNPQPSVSFTDAAGSEWRLGASVALSSNGQVALVGTLDYGGLNAASGAALLFTQPSGGWPATVPATAAMTTFTGGSGFGSVVAVTPDGSVVLLSNGGGEPSGNSMYSEPSGGWTATPPAPAATFTDGALDLGGAQAMSSDGETVLLGGTAVGSIQGSALVYAADGPEQQPQTITFGSANPSPADEGSSYVPQASATSGLPVVFSIAGSSSNVCYINDDTVNFAGVGTCRLVANQPGNGDWSAAPGVEQDITVQPPPPVVSVIDPSFGTPAGGTTVTITGTGFTGASAVSFGFSTATFTVLSDTSIIATAPAAFGQSTADVLVTTPGGTSADNRGDQFTYTTTPSVSGISPMSGSDVGGTQVTMTGSAFTGVTAVNFGSTSASSFTFIADTELVAVAPPSIDGRVDVTVTNSAGTSATNPDDTFTYLPPPTVSSVTPDIGPDNGGTAVAIVGTNFTGVIAVDFGSTAASSFTVINDTQIAATTPPGSDGTVDVTVATPVGESTPSGADQFTYLPTTSTSVSSSVDPSFFGEEVSFTATVANVSGSAAPSGSVQFEIDGSDFGPSVSLTAGAGSSSTAVVDLADGGELHAGSHIVSAVYQGSELFAGSSGSLAGGQTVTPETTQVFVSSSLDPSVSGQAVTFMADVYNVSSEASPPTGFVQFLVDNVNLGDPVQVGPGVGGESVAYSQGVPNLSVGSHTVTARYLSDDGDVGNSEGTLAGGETVNAPATTSTSVSSAVDPSFFGEEVSFTATVANVSGSAAPSGSVQFEIDGSDFGASVSLTAGAGSSSTAVVDLADGGELHAGSHIVSAVYQGSELFAGSSGSLAGGQTVTPETTQVFVSSSLDPSVSGQAVTFMADVYNVSSEASPPTGFVQFLVDNVNLGDPVAVGPGVGGESVAYSQGVPNLSVGSHTVTARYLSDDGDVGNSEGTLASGETVNPAPQTVAFASTPPSPALVGGTYTPTATGGGSGNAVVFTIDSSSSPDSCSISGSTISFVGVGTCVIDANQAGNADYLPAPQIQQSFAVSPAGAAPAIASAISATFAAGSAGSFTVKASGSPAPSMSESGTLPAGVTFTDNGNGTATLAGTPGAGSGGSYAVTITATNTVGSSSQAFVLTVTAPPAITSATATTFTVGQPAGFTVTTSGYPAPSLSESGPLPAGVSFTDNHDGTATIAGNLSAASVGTFPMSITASNTTSSAVEAFTLTVQSGALVITSAASTTMMDGADGSFTVAATGSPTPTIARQGVLPAGVTFSSSAPGTATLSGTPAASDHGIYEIKLIATSSSGKTTQAFTITVNQPAAITSAAAARETAGTPFSFAVRTQGYPTPALTGTGSLPSGVSFKDNGNGTATIAGTAAAGTTTITVTAANTVAATQSFTLTVKAPSQPAAVPAFISTPAATATAGSPFTFQVDHHGHQRHERDALRRAPERPRVHEQRQRNRDDRRHPDQHRRLHANADGEERRRVGDPVVRPDRQPASGTHQRRERERDRRLDVQLRRADPGLPGARNHRNREPPVRAHLHRQRQRHRHDRRHPRRRHRRPIHDHDHRHQPSRSIHPNVHFHHPTTPAITNATSAQATHGTAFSFQFTATGYPTPTITHTGTVPGLIWTSNGNGIATLSGTPKTAGSYTLGITATNNSGTATQTFRLTVN